MYTPVQSLNNPVTEDFVEPYLKLDSSAQWNVPLGKMMEEHNTSFYGQVAVTTIFLLHYQFVQCTFRNSGSTNFSSLNLQLLLYSFK